MSSRSVLQSGEYDPRGADQHSPLPPPPPRDAPYPSPLRRQHAILPTILSTSIPTQAGSNYSTPLSSISRQSPWSAVPQSPLITHASTPMSAQPMASRLSSQFSVPYDPRDWAPGTDTRAAQVQRSRENATEDGLASPPPPYSPEGARSAREGLGRAQTTSAAQSPQLNSSFPQRRILPLSNAPISNRHSIHLGSYAPPPPPPPTTVPPMSRSRIVSDMQNGYDIAGSSREFIIQPPSARRAASANAELSHVSEAGPNRSSSRHRTWVPGMPLPGPPPGPPPSTSRSQSTSGALNREIQSKPRNLRQTIHISDLGPVPPTPLTWSEGQPLPEASSSRSHVSRASISNASYVSPSDRRVRQASVYYDADLGSSEHQPETSSPTTNASANLSRSSAIRDNSAKGLRERRAHNRNSRVFDSDLNVLSVQTNPWADALRSDGSDGCQDSPSLNGPKSARLPPRPSSPLSVAVSSHDQLLASPIQMTNTPPMSPNPALKSQYLEPRAAGLPSKALPTPPLGQKLPSSAQSVMQSHRVSPIITSGDIRDNFEKDARQRHNTFLEKEKLANSDIERLQLFADFVLHEASLRQKNYEAAFLSGGFDVEQFRNSLFKHARDTRNASNSISQVSVDEQKPSTANATSQTRSEAMWWKEYQPALSPIASMDYDEMSSRGRAPSRWWESQTGSHSGDVGGRMVHRSKRESKYMGLSKEFLMANSPSDEYPSAFSHSVVVPDLASYPVEKANPETFGYFEGLTPRRTSGFQPKKPQTPALLDISRFVTLPPPYPRHHPAVNNNHPDLAQYRTTVRTLGNLEEIKGRKAKHKTTVDTLSTTHQRRLSDSRRNFQVNIQSQIANGIITYKEAAEAEEAFKKTEYEAEKQQLQTEFDLLQDAVINPLHDMLHDRISTLNDSIQKLSDDLHTDARYQDPDQPQEEGDEKPELLEKLTQLKWLFDIREQIHRECFDLLSERNDKFRAIVLLPYHFSQNVDKVRDTQAFFDKDAQTRFAAYCNESLQRHESFLQTIEQHVRRGVELQSSAFWDIAPGLLEMLQKIPDDLRHFQGIQIPDKEYKENPSYFRHPQQYLYSLLSHAEKSTYQYIEGQVNLQCLYHEVKTALLGSRYRSLEATEGHDLSDSKAQEEASLTAELKQKASMIEEQWLEALGSQLQATRERVKTLLQEDDAWEEIAAEGA